MTKHEKRLKEYLGEVKELPSLNGKLNKKELAKRAGVPRGSLYGETVGLLIAEAIKTHQLVDPTPDDAVVRLQRKVNTLEITNSELTSQVYELRRKLARLKHIEALAEQGRL